MNLIIIACRSQKKSNIGYEESTLIQFTIAIAKSVLEN